LFFFQAEDGIRDATVTGVQTCALPIYQHEALRFLGCGVQSAALVRGDDAVLIASNNQNRAGEVSNLPERVEAIAQEQVDGQEWRSEERRVGKGCRTGWGP